MTFLMLFLICTFKDPNLVDNFSNFGENLHGVHGVRIFPALHLTKFSSLVLFNILTFILDLFTLALVPTKDFIQN